MTCWDHQGDEIHGSFTPRQIRWIHKNLAVFGEALREAQHQQATGHLMAEALDIPFPRPCGDRATVIASPRNVSGHRLDPVWATSKFLNQMRRNADLVLNSLPETGGDVVLRGPREAWAWIWSLYECGMDVAIRLGIDWGPLPTMRRPGADRAERSYYYVMKWLLRVVDELIDVAELPLPSAET